MMGLRLATLLALARDTETSARAWADLLEQHGQTLYRVNFSLPDVPAHTADLVSKGGKAVLGGPSAPYVSFDFTPTRGAVIEVHQWFW